MNLEVYKACHKNVKTFQNSNLSVFKTITTKTNNQQSMANPRPGYWRMDVNNNPEWYVPPAPLNPGWKWFGAVAGFGVIWLLVTIACLVRCLEHQEDPYWTVPICLVVGVCIATSLHLIVDHFRLGG